MKLQDVSVNDTIKKVKTLLNKEKDLSPALQAAIEMLILVVTLMCNRLGLNSDNSSKPPSSDPNRKRGSKKEKSSNRPGGQNGHKGTHLQKSKNPDKIKNIKVNKRKLPMGNYREVGFKTRQVFDVDISTIVTEYRAQILEDEHGKQYIADFPAAVTAATQYGSTIKATSVYMSQFQMLPYNRIEDYFCDQMNLPLSAGSIFNFNREAYDDLENFDTFVKKKLIQANILHVDETGININKKRLWLHSASNDLWTFFAPHEKRGSEAMDAVGIIPNFSGVLCHDHWKPYYKYQCQHALCNSHHLRELECAAEQDDQKWSEHMKNLLLEIKEKTEKMDGKLSLKQSSMYRKKYRTLLDEADKECPLPESKRSIGQRGRIKKSKSRNLLERLRKFEDDTLRFMENQEVPFTNNLGENDLRMTKVQQKISGCFRSMEGANIFCRVRGYLITCRKHGMMPTEALNLLFAGKLPDFVDDS